MDQGRELVSERSFYSKISGAIQTERTYRMKDTGEEIIVRVDELGNETRECSEITNVRIESAKGS